MVPTLFRRTFVNTPTPAYDTSTGYTRMRAYAMRGACELPILIRLWSFFPEETAPLGSRDVLWRFSEGITSSRVQGCFIVRPFVHAFERVGLSQPLKPPKTLYRIIQPSGYQKDEARGRAVRIENCERSVEIDEVTRHGRVTAKRHGLRSNSCANHNRTLPAPESPTDTVPDCITLGLPKVRVARAGGSHRKLRK